ncbi:MAG: AAA family ATPase [Acidimicrobiales bacterium]
MMPRINVASPSLEFSNRLSAAIGEFEGDSITLLPESFESGSIDEIVEGVLIERPELVVIGPDVDVDMALLVAEQLDADHPEVSVILVAAPTSHTLERAMQAGTRGVLDPDAAGTEIEAVVSRALAVARRRRDLIGGPEVEESSHRVIPILAAKGGSGKSTVASNLAVSLARRFPGDVVIVDLDMQFGDVASAFGVEPVHTFSDLTQHSGPMDATWLKAFLTPRQSAGLYILAAPDTPAQADELQPALVANVVRLLSQEFPYVVVDTAAGIDEFTLEVLDLATDLVLLTSMDVPSVRAVGKEIAALEMLGLKRAEWHLVLNRATSKVGLSIEDIESTLGVQIDVRIPSTRQIPLSVNRGEPISLSDSKSGPARAFDELARRTARVEEKDTGWLRRRIGE